MIARATIPVRLFLSAGSILAARVTRYRTCPRPFLMVLELTDVCNLRCVYCKIYEKKDPGKGLLSTPEIEDLFRNAVRMGLVAVSLSGGGEPMLHGDFPHIVRLARKSGLITAVTTNATLIDEKNVDSFAPCDLVVVSFDSLLPERFDAYAGLPAAERALAGLTILRDRYPKKKICVQMVLDGENWKEAVDFNRYFHARGIDTLFQPRYGSRFDLDPQLWQRMNEQFQFHHRTTKLLFDRFNRAIPTIVEGRDRLPCLALTSTFVVSPTGDVKACHLIDHVQTNVRDRPLREIWRSLSGARRATDHPMRTCSCGDTAYLPYSLFFDGLGVGKPPRFSTSRNE